MHRLYVPTLGPTDWRRLLADPTKQWRPEKSALEMAVCWEAMRATERGLPLEVAAAIDKTEQLRGASLVIGLPEHKVEFEGGGHPSQNDIWALLRVEEDCFVSMAVEGKAGEPLDNIVSVWLTKKSGEQCNKPARLEALQKRLGIAGIDVFSIRYQLLHRAASALKEAVRFRAKYAVLLVQSFNRDADKQSFDDFVRFGDLMGVKVTEERLSCSPRPTVVPLFLGWVTCPVANLARLRDAV